MICEKSVAHYPLENWGKELQYYERIQVVLIRKNGFTSIISINKDYKKIISRRLVCVFNYNLNTLFNLKEYSHTVTCFLITLHLAWKGWINLQLM